MYEIRTATPADAALIRTMLLELAVHEETASYVQCTEADWERALARPDVTVLLAFLNGAAVGYVSAVRQLNLWRGGDVIALDDLYVRESARNRRVGEALMRGLASVASERQLTIRWGVRLDNEAGQRFYRRLGATLTTKVVASWPPERYRAGAEAMVRS